MKQPDSSTLGRNLLMCGLLECIYGPQKYLLTLPPYITEENETSGKGVLMKNLYEILWEILHLISHNT
jgi:hypothetical protein